MPQPSQFLDRHVTAEDLVAGLPHYAHATTADDRAEPVSSRDEASWHF
jgi:hypothetical protein